MQGNPLVDRLYKTLVEEIRARRPDSLLQPFTVAEIYQDLVPYRSHRDRIGAAMNGDYEHALLRLLAGEGGYLVLESESARRRMGEELQSSTQNTGMSRTNAALDVRLNPALIPFDAQEPLVDATATASRQSSDSVGALSPLGGQGAPAPLIAAGVAGRESSLSRAPSLPSRTPARKADDSAAAEPAFEVPENCRWCRGELPRRASLRYCPFCGTDVNLVPCPSCGEELERQWRFCISCGVEVAPDE